MTAIATCKSEVMETNLRSIVNDWISQTSSTIVIATTGIRDKESAQTFVSNFVRQAGSPWFRYILTYDPEANLKKIRAKVLALNGDKDIQVISNTNLVEMENALKAGKSREYEIKEMPALNHLFQECNACTVAEYADLEQTISPKVLDLIGSWLTK